MKENQVSINSEIVDTFIRSIQALNFIEMKKYLAHYGENIVNCLQSRTRMPSLYFAIRITDQRIGLAVIKQLTNHGGNLTFRDLFGNSYLHYTCHFQKMSIFKFLLQNKLPANSINSFNQSVLFSIAQNNHLQIIRYLCQFQQQINVNQQDKLGRTALFYAADKGHIQMCEILLKMGTDANKTDKQGHTVQYYARKQQKTQVINLLSRYKKKENHMPTTIQQLYTFNLHYLSPKFSISILSVGQVLDFLKIHKELNELFMNPETIEERQIQEKTNCWQQKADRMIDLCRKRQGSQFFQYPVDQEMFGISDYYNRIKRPMDFSTIKCKLSYNGYTDSKQFIQDVELVFANCAQYNGQGHYITELALKIRKYFRSICVF